MPGEGEGLSTCDWAGWDVSRVWFDGAVQEVYPHNMEI